MKVGILGTGSVALALGKGWLRERHQLLFGSRNPAKQGDVVYGLGKGAECGTVRDAAAFGDVVVLAVPYRHVPDTIKAAGPATFKGKTVLDVTNPHFGDDRGVTTSGAEEIQKQLPGAKVVKALNYVFADNMALGRFGAQRLAGFVAADDAAAKQNVLQLVVDLGFEPVDAGPLRSARFLEGAAMLIIQLGHGQKMGTGVGLALARRAR
jgi:8-hydroxy-5-deazaflavin:NADPH oxidoreductase